MKVTMAVMRSHDFQFNYAGNATINAHVIRINGPRCGFRGYFCIYRYLHRSVSVIAGLSIEVGRYFAKKEYL